jgi:hypothetical protein
MGVTTILVADDDDRLTACDATPDIEPRLVAMQEIRSVTFLARHLG